MLRESAFDRKDKDEDKDTWWWTEEVGKSIERKMLVRWSNMEMKKVASSTEKLRGKWQRKRLTVSLDTKQRKRRSA